MAVDEALAKSKPEAFCLRFFRWKGIGATFGYAQRIREVEKVLPPDAAFKHPVCLAGANACPPEDCGGVWGYYNLLGILADSKHPEHEEMKEWIGEEFDPAAFDLNGVNSGLKQLKG